MKKNTVIAFLLLLTLAFCSCTDRAKENETAFMSESRAFLRPGIAFCSDGTTAYFLGNMLLGGNQIQFADLQSGVSAPLCGKPECSHQDETCDAMLNPVVQGLSIYADKLYWVSSQDYQPHIFCSEPDGTGRRDVRLLDNSIFQSIGGNQMLCFWQNYLIACGDTYEVNDGQEESGAAVAVFSLSDPEKDLILMQEASQPEQYMAARIQPFGEYLYGLHTTEQALVIWRWKPGMEAVETIFNGNAPCVVHAFWMREQDILLSSADDGTVYSLDWQTKEFRPVFTMADHKRIEFVEGLAVGMMRAENGNLALTIASLDGSGMQTISVQDSDGAAAFCGGDESNLYIYCVNLGSCEDRVIALSRADGTSKTIWKGVLNLGAEN